MSAAAQLRARAIGRESSLANASVDEQGPMSASLSGKFGSRAASTGMSSGLNPNAASFTGRFTPSPGPEPINTSVRATSEMMDTPQTPAWNQTTVISGGTPLGGLAGGRETLGANSNGNNSANATPSASYNGLSGYNSGSGSVGPSKSDAAVSWRRGSTVSTPVTSNSPVIGSRSGSASPPRRGHSA